MEIKLTSINDLINIKKAIEAIERIVLQTEDVQGDVTHPYWNFGIKLAATETFNEELTIKLKIDNINKAKNALI